MADTYPPGASLLPEIPVAEVRELFQRLAGFENTGAELSLREVRLLLRWQEDREVVCEQHQLSLIERQHADRAEISRLTSALTAEATSRAAAERARDSLAERLAEREHALGTTCFDLRASNTRLEAERDHLRAKLRTAETERDAATEWGSSERWKTGGERDRYRDQLRQVRVALGAEGEPSVVEAAAFVVSQRDDLRSRLRAAEDQAHAIRTALGIDADADPVEAIRDLRLSHSCVKRERDGLFSELAQISNALSIDLADEDPVEACKDLRRVVTAYEGRELRCEAHCAEADAKAEALLARVEQLKKLSRDLCAERNTLTAERDELSRRVEALELLAPYAWHDLGCPARDDGACNCGLDDARAKADALRADHRDVKPQNVTAEPVARQQPHGEPLGEDKPKPRVPYRCRECGCTGDGKTCSDHDGDPIEWAAKDLCSACGDHFAAEDFARGERERGMYDGAPGASANDCPRCGRWTSTLVFDDFGGVMCSRCADSARAPEDEPERDGWDDDADPRGTEGE